MFDDIEELWLVHQAVHRLLSLPIEKLQEKVWTVIGPPYTVFLVDLTVAI